MALQPLPQAAITVAKLRRQADEVYRELNLLADEIAANAGLKEYQPTRKVEFAYSKEKLAAGKPQPRRKRP